MIFVVKVPWTSMEFSDAEINSLKIIVAQEALLFHVIIDWELILFIWSDIIGCIAWISNYLPVTTSVCCEQKVWSAHDRRSRLGFRQMHIPRLQDGELLGLLLLLRVPRKQVCVFHWQQIQHLLFHSRS